MTTTNNMKTLPYSPGLFKKNTSFLPKKTSDVQVNQWIFSGEVISTLGFFSLGTGAMLTPPSPSQPCRGGFHHPGKTCGSGGVVPLCVGPVPAASGAASWTCSNTRRHGGVATVWGRKMCKPQAVESIYTVPLGEKLCNWSDK